MRTILFVVPPYLMERGNVPSRKLRSFKALPYGILSIATYIRRNSKVQCAIHIFDCNNYSNDLFSIELRTVLSTIKPDIVGITMMFDISYNFIDSLTHIIKETNDHAIVVMGGAATLPSYTSIINTLTNIDAICYSEGELPFLRLVDSDNMKYYLEHDKSWITRCSLKNGIVPDKAVINDLDNVIDIDYAYIDIDTYSMKEAFSPFVRSATNRKQFFIVTSRGCPYKCAFCMRSQDSDRSMRYASIEKVVDHVKYLIDHYGMTVLTIYDDQLLFNKPRAKHLFRELAQFNLRIECPNGLSVAFIDDEMAYLMRNSGMDTVNLAIESGSPYVLKHIIDKPLNLSMAKNVINILRKYDFWIYGSFVIGFPGEMDEHRDETIQFIYDAGLDWSGFCHAVPYRGTKLYKICVENGYISSDIGIGEFDSTNFFINTPDYSAEYITNKIYLMNLRANFVNNYRMRQRDYDVAAQAFNEVAGLYPDHAFAHYFKALALQGSEDNDAERDHAMNTFYRIINSDEKWRGYAKHFGII